MLLSDLSCYAGKVTFSDKHLALTVRHLASMCIRGDISWRRHTSVLIMKHVNRRVASMPFLAILATNFLLWLGTFVHLADGAICWVFTIHGCSFYSLFANVFSFSIIFLMIAVHSLGAAFRGANLSRAFDVRKVRVASFLLACAE